MIAQAWPSNFPLAFSSIPVGKLMGHPDFEAAKHGGDAVAAMRLVTALADPAPVLAQAKQNKNLRMIALSSANQANQIPSAFARHMATAARIPLDVSGLKANSPKHSGKSALYRFANRAQFAGSVRRGAQYLMVDDVLTQGGTLSEMRQWIVRSGGMVSGVAVLAVTPFRDRKDFDPATIALTAGTRAKLEKRFGAEPLAGLFSEQGVYGGQWKAMTEGEAWMILGYRSLPDFRAALLTEAAKATMEGKEVDIGITPAPVVVDPSKKPAPNLPTDAVKSKGALK